MSWIRAARAVSSSAPVDRESVGERSRKGARRGYRISALSRYWLLVSNAQINGYMEPLFSDLDFSPTDHIAESLLILTIAIQTEFPRAQRLISQTHI
jgi:hypothetical protein